MTRRPGRQARPADAAPPNPEAAPLSFGVVPVSAPTTSVPDRLTLRLDDLAKALGVSRRALERERSAGRLPRPDLTIGRMPLWRPETIREWIGRGSLT